MESSPPENADVKPAFRKPSNDAANRKYRRHSPADGSTSSDEDLQHDHASSPKYTRGDPVKGHDYRERKKDDEKDLGRDSGRSHYGRTGDSHKYSERHSSRTAYTHSRHDDHRRRESDHSRSRDYMRDRDKHTRDKYESNSYRGKDWDRSDRDRDDRDEKREYHRSSRDHKSGWDKEEPKAHLSESTAARDRDGQKLVKEKRSFEDSDSKNERKPSDDKSNFGGDRNSPTKKPCHSSSNGGPDSMRNVHGSKQSQEVTGKTNSAFEAANDLNAAKFAAMRAAELVNMNLTGGAGYMSTEQKKKLLWGNKKSTTNEESARQWNVSHIADPEREEKFNKLMGVKGDVKPSEQKPVNEDGSSQIQAEKQRELQLNLEKQYTAGLRRRDGRTVGLGL